MARLPHRHLLLSLILCHGNTNPTVNYGQAFVSVLLRDFVSSEKTREKRRAYMRQCLEAIEAEITAGNVRDFEPQALVPSSRAAGRFAC